MSKVVGDKLLSDRELEELHARARAALDKEWLEHPEYEVSCHTRVVFSGGCFGLIVNSFLSVENLIVKQLEIPISTLGM